MTSTASGTTSLGTHTIALINPATEQLIVDQPLATAADADAAIARAAAALPTWRSLAPLDRIKLMRRFADTIAAHAEELAQLETANMGMPIGNSRWCANTAADVIHYYAGCIDKHTGSTIPVAGGVTMTFHEPLGVVGDDRGDLHDHVLGGIEPSHLQVHPHKHPHRLGRRLRK